MQNHYLIFADYYKTITDFCNGLCNVKLNAQRPLSVEYRPLTQLFLVPPVGFLRPEINLCAVERQYKTS